eukprot:217705-Pleurochrysis_carterae.AAC.1
MARRLCMRHDHCVMILDLASVYAARRDVHRSVALLYDGARALKPPSLRCVTGPFWVVRMLRRQSCE